jgi:hypothetical protein
VKTVLARVQGPAFVPAVVTPLTPVEAAGRLRAYPETNRLSGPLLMALIWVETQGRPIAFNVGNITASARYDGEAWRPPWWEVGPSSSPRLLELNARMKAGKAPSAFRAYENFADGFHDFMSQLKANFAEVLEAANTGDAARFVDALSLKYSRDYGAKHYRSFRTLQSQFEPWFKDLSASHRTSNSPSQQFGEALLFGGLFLLAKALS